MIKLPRLYRRLPVVLKAKLRTKQNDWWTGLTERTQRYADMGDMGAFYEAFMDPHIRSKPLYAVRMEVPC